MQKQIKTFFAFNDFEINAPCSKPPTFEGFAENACHVFFPEIVKYNFEQVEPQNLIPIGFLQNHTYYNTVYYKRALEWKFIFDNDKNKAKEFENDLAIIVWYIGKSFEQSDKNEEETFENFNDVKQTLNKNFIFLPDFQVNWFCKQDTFIKSFNSIFKQAHNEEGFEKTKSLALQYSIAPKFLKRMLNELKTVFNMVDDEQILDYVFIDNEPLKQLEDLAAKGEYHLKTLFDLITYENIDELIKENISLTMYEFLCKFKMPEDLVKIIKVLPQFYKFISNNDGEEGIKEILSTDNSKSEIISNLIKYVQKKGNNHEKINSFLDIIKKNNSIIQFLLEISKISDLETVSLLLSQYETHFSTLQLTDPIDQIEAMAICLNLHFNFGFDIAQKAFHIKDDTFSDLKNKLLKEDNDINMSYLSNFLIELKPELQISFIKNLGKTAQQQLRNKLSKCKNFALKMKLAPIISKIKV